MTDQFTNGPSDEQKGSERQSGEKLADQAMKFASETAYAAAGFANVVADKAKAFYETQKAQYAETHPDTTSQGAKQFLDQLSDQLTKFIDDVQKGYKDMAERGRTVVSSRGATTQPRDDKGPFDMDDDVMDAPADDTSEAEPANATTEVPVDAEEHVEETVISDAPTTENPENENKHF